MRFSVRLGALLLASAAGLLPLGCDRNAASAPSRPAARPHVIFFMLDTLRADRLGAYGHKGDLTPTMDALAREGALFEHAVATAPWTLPSVGSLVTGFYPTVHKATLYTEVSDMREGKVAKVPVLSPDFTLLSEVYQAAGYQTVGFCANPFVQPEFGFAQGFGHFDATFADNHVNGDVLNKAAFAWLDEHRDSGKPLFLYLHYMDCHGPYNADPRFMDPLLAQVEKLADKRALSAQEMRGLLPYMRTPPPNATDPGQYARLWRYREYWVARYEAGVRQQDHYLAEMIARLKQMGVWENAFVVLVADHGEAFGEHFFWEHGYSQYETDLHVPMILRWPGQIPAAKRIRETVRLIDVLPTLLEYKAIPLSMPVQGMSLAGLIDGKGPAPETALSEARKYYEKSGEQKALHSGPWKLIFDYKSGKRVLYNVAEDPGETFDLSSSKTTELKALSDRMDAINKENAALAKTVREQLATISDEMRRRLAGLGYLAGDEPDDSPSVTQEEKPATQTQPASAADSVNPDKPTAPPASQPGAPAP